MLLIVQLVTDEKSLIKIILLNVGLVTLYTLNLILGVESTQDFHE
jgi:hypothetical protein|tara:strand:+ start:110 stop:244 length:135 start_codon:yes stop_codon:yes gene_type:complete